MRYYHISLEVDNQIEEFAPKLPSAIYKEEDASIPRICLSESIEGCLSGFPAGGRKLEGVVAEHHSLFEDLNPNLNEGDTFMDYSLLFRVYEFEKSDIQEGNLIETEDLLLNGYVMDADSSEEVWVINQNLKPVKTYLVLLTEYTEGAGDVFSQEYYHLTEDQAADIDISDYIIGMTTKIEGIEFEVYDSLEEIPYQLDLDKWKEILEELKEENYEVSY